MACCAFRQGTVGVMATSGGERGLPSVGEINVGNVELQPLLTKLKRRSLLDSKDEAAILTLPFELKTLRTGGYLVRSGKHTDFNSVLLHGFACRQKAVGGGRRQITALQMPGDTVDLHNWLFQFADYSVQAMSAVTIAQIPRAALIEVTTRFPAIMRAFGLDALVDASISMEWMANIGRRNALMRLAHLLCEIAVRRELIDSQDGQSPYMRMTQEHLGDALGLTAVHVNRMFKQLERDGLISQNKSTFVILDMPRLQAAAGFEPAYLHLESLPDE